MGGPVTLTGPDFTKGVLASDVPEGRKLLGHAHGEPVLLVRDGGELFAIGAVCTHYSANLADGVLADGAVRCPMHHACFSLRTGEAVRSPALNPVTCWKVEPLGDTLVVREKQEPARRVTPAPRSGPASVVIIGGGAAGHSAAETLRREGYGGPVTLVCADVDPPYDRPNVSKDLLAGTAPAEWMPLRGDDFYKADMIDLLVGVRATAIDRNTRTVTLSDGRALPFGALLLATGADATRLTIAGAELPHVFTVRTMRDTHAIIARAKDAKRAVVVGASFIGLESAAALRARNLDVTVVGPGARPLEPVLGPAVGDFIRTLHESHGVTFRMGVRPSAIDEHAVVLESGEALPADLVILGVGVKPATALAEAAGLAVDRGILVNDELETSARGVFAAGDVARFPDPMSPAGDLIRIEHWVVAQRHGQLAARNMLGRHQKNSIVPFFWSQHYDVAINYVGHAEPWDEARVEGDLAARNCRVDYLRDGKLLAVATINRDQDALAAAVAFERALPSS